MPKSPITPFLIFGLLFIATHLCAAAPADPYENYLKNSKDFHRVKQDKNWILKAWPSWLYMPWYYQWGIGHKQAGADFSKKHGYNGAFLDHGDTQNLAWIEKNQLRFYMDHTAGKGSLYLYNKKPQDKTRLKNELPGNGVRPVALNASTTQDLKKQIFHNIEQVRHSPQRAAYALDDEISSGSFVRPCTWRLIEDFAPYLSWLDGIYGKGNKPDYKRPWITYDDLRKKLPNWTLAEFDCGQLMDQWTFNDAYWANYLGDLVAYSNSIDPATPCGFVGGQSPSAMGGYDYARLMRKIQFIEAYNIGSSQAVIRSFNPHNALPTVTTHFHRSVNDTIWQAWYYLAQGNRGHIGWVQDWFDGKKPKSWHQAVAPHYLEIAEKISPLLADAEWLHDGVAIYYSHPSIQMSWILDAEAHGSTWPNRNSDHRLGTSHLVRKAWENMLRDSGYQFSHLSYIDLVQNEQALDKFKVLILPATYCLSEAEARRIRAFVLRGGTVIADFLPGVFDQHGRGRNTGGVLDDVFAIQHQSSWKATDIFSVHLWVEADQEANFYFKSYEDLLDKNNNPLRHPAGFARAARNLESDSSHSYGEGKAVLMNLSPQWYHALRGQGAKAAASRSVFMKHLGEAGIQSPVRLSNNLEEVFGYEITYWKKDNRTLLFLIMNPEVTGTSTGGGNSQGLKTKKITVTLEFQKPVDQVRNELNGKILGDGKKFTIDWITNKAVVLSFNE
ncbi:MAG: beta-galactosidase trimerization domain-containing protein [Verrucomicrobiota bacterium]